MGHFEPRMGHFDAKIGHFEAKSDRFEAKMVFRPVLKAKFSKIQAAFFSINSLFGLKANGPFSAKSWPGPLLKPKFAIWSLERAILKPKLAILKLKVTVLKQKWSFGRFGRPNFPKFKPHFFR